MPARDHIDKAGLLGAVFAALCCLGISAVVSIVPAPGLGFLLNDAVLLPLLVVSLLVTLWGLFSGWRRHHTPSALGLGALGGSGLFAFSFVRQSRPLALASVGVLVISSLLNAVMLHRRHSTAEGGTMESCCTVKPATHRSPAHCPESGGPGRLVGR